MVQRKITSPHLASALALALAAMAASPASAQEAARAAAADDSESTAADAGLGDIVVTARKVAENLQDVPVAITAFTGADLQNQNIQQAQDLAKFTPGLAIRAATNTPSAIAITLRGQVQTDVLVTLDPSIGTYVDGIYWARAYGLNSDLLDVSSVQVLKGPQGTLFGRNTTGGALIIDTNDPDLDEFTGRASLTYGRFNEFQATGIVNLPIVSDKIALRLAGQRQSRDGYSINSVPATATSAVAANNPTVARPPFAGDRNGLRYDERDRWNFRGKLLLKPTDTFSLLFSGEYFELDERSPGRVLVAALSAFATPNPAYVVGSTAATFVGLSTGNTPATATAAGLATLNNQIAFLNANPRLVSNNEVPYAFARTQTYNAIGTLDTDWGALKLLTGYRKIEAFAGVDLEGSSFPIHITESQQAVKQYSGELQITGKAFDNAVDFAVGGFAFHETGFDQSISITVPTLNPVTSHFYGKIDNDSIGVYGQATWHITDAFSFTGGLRYSVDDKGLETRNNNYNRTTGLTTCSIVAAGNLNLGTELVAVPQCAVKRRDDFGGVSYTAGFEYKPTEDILIYLKTSKGFRAGGQNLRAPAASLFVPFRPEVAYSHELGFKGEFFDRRLRANVAAYYTDVNDIQRTTLVPQPGGAAGLTATILGNAGKARFKGFEAEVQALLFDGFRLSGSLAHVDPSYVRYADLSGDRSFERFRDISRWQYALAADYSRTIGEIGLKLRLDYSWLGKQPTDSYFFVANPNNAQIVAATTKPAIGLLGARAGVSFADDMFELAVFGRNITNNRRYSQILLVAALGYVTGTRQEPATYGITGTVRF